MVSGKAGLKFYLHRNLDLSFDDFSDFRLINALTTIKKINGKIHLSNGDSCNQKAFDMQYISIDDLLDKHFKKGKSK